MERLVEEISSIRGQMTDMEESAQSVGLDQPIGRLSRAGKTSAVDDSYIRKAALRFRVPYITTVAAATAKGLAAVRQGAGEIRFLQDYSRR